MRPSNRASAPDPLTDRVRATWTAGDFGRIAKGYSRGAGEFIARLELEPDERVLDVACGTGNLALPAARIGASVTGIDIAPNLIAQAKARAAAERLADHLRGRRRRAAALRERHVRLGCHDVRRDVRRAS